MIRQPTDDERAALLRATWRPWVEGTGATAGRPGPRGRVPAVVMSGDLLASLDGWPLGGGRTAYAGGLYEVRVDRWPATAREVQRQGWIAVEQGGRLWWYVAVLP